MACLKQKPLSLNYLLKNKLSNTKFNHFGGQNVANQPLYLTSTFYGVIISFINRHGLECNKNKVLD